MFDGNGRLLTREANNSRPVPLPNLIRWRWAVLTLGIIAALVLRVALDNYSFLLDEIFSLSFADEPMSHLWGNWMVRETNPPLFYTVLKAWAWLGANSITSLRMLPNLGAAIEMILVAEIARRRYGWWAALSAVVLIGLSYQHLYIGQFLRAYIFVIDSVALSLLGLSLWLDGGRMRNFGLALYVVGGTLGCYFHTTMFLWPVIASAGVFLVYFRDLTRDSGRLLAQLAAADLVIGALGSWWIWITLEQLRTGAPGIAWLRATTMPEYVYLITRNTFLIFDASPADRLAHYVLRFGILASIIVLRRDRFSWLLIVLIILAAVLFKLTDVVHPIADGATLFWITLFPVLLISGSIQALGRPSYRSMVIVVLAFILAVNLFQHRRDLLKQDWTGMVTFMTRQQKAALLVQHADIARLAQRTCIFESGKPCAFPIVVARQSTGVPSRELDGYGELTTMLANYDRVYTLRAAPDADPLLTLCMVKPADRPSYQPFLEGPFSPLRLSIAQNNARHLTHCPS
jgi:hypothetical protein